MAPDVGTQAVADFAFALSTMRREESYISLKEIADTIADALDETECALLARYITCYCDQRTTTAERGA